MIKKIVALPETTERSLSTMNPLQNNLNQTFVLSIRIISGNEESMKIQMVWSGNISQ